MFPQTRIKLFSGFTSAPYDEFNNKIEQLDYLSNIDMQPQSYVFWEPEIPNQGEVIQIKYDSYLGVLNGVDNPIHIHIGYNDWQNIIEPNPEMVYDPDSQLWLFEYEIPFDAYSVNFAFNNGDDYWDNNGGQDWFFLVDESDSILGDVNFDQEVNITDIVLIVGHILGSNILQDQAILAADFNSDSQINIVDVVQIVNEILYGF